MAMDATDRRENTTAPARRTYEAPAIAWEEDFEPAGQVTGCADVGDNCPERPET
jgi:hypothetical protein